jgi:hypothetical protein
LAGYSRPIGGHLLHHLMAISSGRLLVGAWQAATWAIRFYERHGFRRLDDPTGQDLLRRYWQISARQLETSLVLEKQE